MNDSYGRPLISNVGHDIDESPISHIGNATGVLAGVKLSDAGCRQKRIVNDNMRESSMTSVSKRRQNIDAAKSRVNILYHISITKKRRRMVVNKALWHDAAYRRSVAAWAPQRNATYNLFDRVIAQHARGMANSITLSPS